MNSRIAQCGYGTAGGTVATLKEEAVERLGEVVGLSDPCGYIASGGTEANIQAVRAARNRLHVDKPNVVAPEHVHFSVHKAVEVLGVELRTVPLTDELIADTGAVEAAVDSQTILDIGVAGSTEYGRVDPIPELAAIAKQAGALVHVDAAWADSHSPSRSSSTGILPTHRSIR